MSTFLSKIQETYGYSNYEMAVIKYSLTALFSELSKIIILGGLFLSIGKFDLFVAAATMLALLRLNNGGYHCNHYITCLLFSGIVLYTAIVLLPLINIPNFSIVLIALTVCLFINYYIGPIPSPFRPEPNSLLIKQCKNKCFIIIFCFIIIVSIFNSNTIMRPYLIVGFWITILHTLQLIIAKIQRKGE